MTDAPQHKSSLQDSSQHEPSPPAPPATPTNFVIEIPTLSRGTADRSEDLREPSRLQRKWSRSRVITMDHSGRVEFETDHSDTPQSDAPHSDAPQSDAPTIATAPIDPPPIETHGLRLLTRAATGLSDAPLAGAVLLGAVDGVDHWAVRGEVTGGGGLRELGSLLSDSDAGLLTTATALLSWHAAAGFCPRCGAQSAPTAAGWSRICASDHQDFPRTDAAVIVLVHDGADSIVLARQPVWPTGRMSVLAGFVEAGESLEGTVAREVLEEVGVHVTDVSYLGSQPWPFPRSLMVGFAARAEPGAILRPRDGEIEEAQWFDRATILAMIAAEDANQADTWATQAPVPAGSAFTVVLPGPVSIARRMIEGWARSG